MNYSVRVHCVNLGYLLLLPDVSTSTLPHGTDTGCILHHTERDTGCLLYHTEQKPSLNKADLKSYFA